MLLTLACAFAACTQPFPTAPDDALLLSQGGGDVAVAYYCGNTFQFRNRSQSGLTLQWRVHGVQEHGAVFLPARGAAEYSETYLTTQERGPLQVAREGRVFATVPNGHTAHCEPPVSFPDQVPDSVPAWVYADSNLVRDDSVVSGVYPRGILIVTFSAASTVAERGTLTASIGAEVVGGKPGRATPNGRTADWYFLRLTGDRSSTAMQTALATLLASPIVANASFEFQVDLMSRKPQDGLGWKLWSTDGTASLRETWGLEAIRAPLAWGCTTGSSSTLVGVVDHGFTNTQDLTENASSLLAPGWTTAATPHGTFVASVLGAQGNNQLGISGVQWDADLLLYDVQPIGGSYTTDMALGYELVSMLGARVVNLSWGIYWSVQYGRLPNSALSVDRNRRDMFYQFFENELSRVAMSGYAPLVVLSAGNDPVDAGWSGLPLAATGSHGDRVIVVGATDRLNQAAGWSATGPLISIYAPGEGVYGLDGAGVAASGNGTSFAAPYVTGVAGLLFSLDPSLTPAMVKQLILAGAVRRNVAVEQGFLLDAYEPLKLASERPGLPLCGNRLWSVGNQVYAARATGAELVGTVSDEVGQVLPYHGGRKVLIQKGESARFAVYELREARGLGLDRAVGPGGQHGTGRVGVLRRRPHARP